MSLLFQELDCDKTCDRVDEFLTEDLEKLILMSGRNLTDLRSPTLSLAPGHSNGTKQNYVQSITQFIIYLKCQK